MMKIQLGKMDKTLSDIEISLENLPQELLYKIMFICEEILTNLARHADFTNETPDVSLSLDTNSTTTLTFKDNAAKFNMLEYPDPDISSDIDERNLGGLGIYLSKKYSKNISYSYENNCNILKVTL
ncbi:MAG: ATP-binding protein [Campylobacterota bacterium]|nr:ATP-binding protein [Campylobacterota bacterium]